MCIRDSYHHDRERITGPLYIGSTDSDRRPVHLLFITHPEKDTLPGHFRPITNMKAMVSTLDKSKRNSPLFCEKCLLTTRSEADLAKHQYWCGTSGKPQLVRMPDDCEKEHRFKDHQKTTRLLNIVDADLESRIDPVTHLHTPGYIGALQVWHPHHAEENTDEVEVFKGKDCVMQFLDYLEGKARENMDCLDLFTHQPIDMSAAEEYRHYMVMTCEFCELPFTKERFRCADHDHITGRYLRTLCSKCNLKRVQYRRRMSVVFQNLKGYDGHHLMRYGLAQKFDWELTPIYQSGDKLLGVIVRIPLGPAGEVGEEEEEEQVAEEEEEEELPKSRRRCLG